MPTITINVPAGSIADIRAALQERYGAEVDGFTNQQLLVHHLKATTRPLVRAYRRRQDVSGAMANEEAARAVAEAALETERTARLAAEAVADAAGDAAVNGVS